MNTQQPTTFKILRSLLRSMRKGKWILFGDFYIRSDNFKPYYCPLTFVCKIETGFEVNLRDYQIAANKLNINNILADNIVKAADKEYKCLTDKQRKLRRILLKGTNLYAEKIRS